MHKRVARLEPHPSRRPAGRPSADLDGRGRRAFPNRVGSEENVTFHPTKENADGMPGRAKSFSVSARSTGVLTAYRARGRQFAVAQDARMDDPGLTITRNPGDVG